MFEEAGRALGSTEPAPLTAEPSCLVTASDDVITTHDTRAVWVPGRVCLRKEEGTVPGDAPARASSWGRRQCGTWAQG